MVGIALLLFGAAGAHLLARALNLPQIPLLLLAGVVLSGTVSLDVILLEDALILGVAFLLFATGTELDPGQATNLRRAILSVAVLQVILLAALGFVAAALFGFDRLESAFIALALTASSTVIGVRLLRRRKQMFEPFGRLVIGVLLLQDLFVILLIPLVTTEAGGLDGVLRQVAAVALLLLLAWALRTWGTLLLARLDGDRESMLIASLAVLFGFVALARLLQLPIVAGAFIAGVGLSRFPFRSMLRSRLTPVNDFFSAVFFTALGALISLPRAALLSQTSELSLIVGLYGMLEGHISESVFTIIALVTLITMMLTPLLTSDRMVWRLMRLHPLRVESRAALPAAGHILVLGSGTTGMPLLETLLAAGNQVVVVDDDAAVIARLREADVPCIRGDAADIEVLREANAQKARLITSTIRRPADNRRLLEYARGVPVLVRVFEEEDAEWIRRLGGTPVLYSAAAAESLTAWLDREQLLRA